MHVQVFGDDPLSWSKLPKWWISSNALADGPDWEAFQLGDLRQHNGIVVRFVGIENRDAALCLRGNYVAAPPSLLPTTQPGEFYWHELIGLVVVNTQGEAIGKVAQLIESTAHHVIEVQKPNGQYTLLPFVNQVILDVDLIQQQLRVDWESDW